MLSLIRVLICAHNHSNLIHASIETLITFAKENIYFCNNSLFGNSSDVHFWLQILLLCFLFQSFSINKDFCYSNFRICWEKEMYILILLYKHSATSVFTKTHMYIECEHFLISIPITFTKCNTHIQMHIYIMHTSSLPVNYWCFYKCFLHFQNLSTLVVANVKKYFFK